MKNGRPTQLFVSSYAPRWLGQGTTKSCVGSPSLSIIRIADVYRKAPCRKYNARRFKSQASSPPQRLRARWTTFRRPAGRGHACGAVAPKSSHPPSPLLGSEMGGGVTEAIYKVRGLSEQTKKECVTGKVRQNALPKPVK